MVCFVKVQPQEILLTYINSGGFWLAFWDLYLDKGKGKDVPVLK
jgi:hypothetical protein